MTRYRAVRSAGSSLWHIQWRWLCFKGWAKRYIGLGFRIKKVFDNRADAEKEIKRLIERDRDPGERGAWQP